MIAALKELDSTEKYLGECEYHNHTDVSIILHFYDKHTPLKHADIILNLTATLDAKAAYSNADFCNCGLDQCLSEIFSLVLMGYEDRDYYASRRSISIMQTKIQIESRRS